MIWETKPAFWIGFIYHVIVGTQNTIYMGYFIPGLLTKTETGANKKPFILMEDGKLIHFQEREKTGHMNEGNKQK